MHNSNPNWKNTLILSRIILITILIVYSASVGTLTAFGENILTADPPEEVGVGRSFTVLYHFSLTDDISALHIKLCFDSNISFKKAEPSISCYKKIYKKSDGVEMIIIPDEYFISSDTLSFTFTAVSGAPSGEHKIDLNIIQAIDTEQNNVELSADSFTIKATKASDSSSSDVKSKSSNSGSVSVYSGSIKRSASSKTTVSSGSIKTEKSKTSSAKITLSSQAKTKSSTTVSRASRSSRKNQTSVDGGYDANEGNETEYPFEEDVPIEYYSNNNSADIKLRYILIGVFSTLSVIIALYYVFMMGKRAGEKGSVRSKDDFD